MKLRLPPAAAALAITAACTNARPAPAPRPESRQVAQAQRGPSPAGAPVAVDARMLIRRAAMDVAVDEVARADARTQAMMVAFGGYVERAERSEKYASFTLRVPEASLNALLDSLATLGKVGTRTVSAEDVTEQAIDLDARLQALLATRTRLRQLQETAKTVTEVIEVERELARVQGEVDSLEGRLKHLRSSAALAQVELSLRRRVVLGPLGVIAQGLGNFISKLFVLR
jgi:hypothetical protein